MVFTPAIMLLIKSLTIILLAFANPRYVVCYYLVDIGFFLLMKIVRRDFIYWVPIEGSSKYVVSLFIRIAVKIVADFTCVVQLRHPNEVGGLYWTLQNVLTLTTLFIALVLVEETKTFQGADLEMLWTISWILSSSSLLMFFIFFKNINQGYIR